MYFLWESWITAGLEVFQVSGGKDNASNIGSEPEPAEEIRREAQRIDVIG